MHLQETVVTRREQLALACRGPEDGTAENGSFVRLEGRRAVEGRAPPLPKWRQSRKPGMKVEDQRTSSLPSDDAL